VPSYESNGLRHLVAHGTPDQAGVGLVEECELLEALIGTVADGALEPEDCFAQLTGKAGGAAAT
jgi:hypothetical protein